MIWQELKSGNWSAISRLPKITWLMLYLVTAAVCLVLGALAVISFTTAQEDLSAAQAKEQTLRAELLKKKQIEANLKLFEAQVVEAQKQLIEVKKQIPAELEIGQFLSNLSATALDNGIKLAKIESMPEKQEPYYTAQPVKLNGCATYHQLGGFTAALTRLDRIITLDLTELGAKSSSSEIGGNTECGSDSSSVPFMATVQTYRYKDSAATSGK